MCRGCNSDQNTSSSSSSGNDSDAPFSVIIAIVVLLVVVCFLLIISVVCVERICRKRLRLRQQQAQQGVRVDGIPLDALAENHKRELILLQLERQGGTAWNHNNNNNNNNRRQAQRISGPVLDTRGAEGAATTGMRSSELITMIPYVSVHAFSASMSTALEGTVLEPSNVVYGEHQQYYHYSHGTSRTSHSGDTFLVIVPEDENDNNNNNNNSSTDTTNDSHELHLAGNGMGNPLIPQRMSSSSGPLTHMNDALRRLSDESAPAAAEAEASSSSFSDSSTAVFGVRLIASGGTE